VHRRDEFRASKIMLDRARHNPKVKFLANTVVEEVYDVSKEIVTGVRLRNVKSDQVWDQEVDGFFLAIGHIPYQGLQGADRDRPDGYILSKGGARTNIAGVFHAGDVQDRTYRQPSRRRARAAWRPSRPNVFWNRKDSKPHDRAHQSSRRTRAARSLLPGGASRRFHFRSGQVPVNPATGEMVKADMARETRQVLNNIKSVLESCGATMADAGALRRVPAGRQGLRGDECGVCEFFGEAKPARATVVTDSRCPEYAR